MVRTVRQKHKKTLAERMIGTLLILVLFRILCHIPLPFTDSSVLGSLSKTDGMTGLLNMVLGGSLFSASFGTLGVGPYITASIIVQLLTAVVPALTKLQKQGAYGIKKIKQMTLAIAVVFALTESIGMTLGYRASGVYVKDTWYVMLISIVCLGLTSGFLSYLGNYIEEKLFGNGVSLFITTGILATYSELAVSMAMTMSKKSLLLFGLFVILLSVLVVWLDACEEQIVVSYGERDADAADGMPESVIPLKPMAGNVMPIIFASSVFTFPQLLSNMFDFTLPKGFAVLDMSAWMDKERPWATLGVLIYAALIFYFSYYYQALSFNEQAIAEDLKKQGGMIVGVRPGLETEAYLKKRFRKVVFLGAVGVCIIAIIPVFVGSVLGVSRIGTMGSSVIITISVVTQTWREFFSEKTASDYVQHRKKVFGPYGLKALFGTENFSK